MPTVTPTKQKEVAITADQAFIADDELNDVFIPDVGIGESQIPQTDTFPEILTDPTQAEQRAKKTLEIAQETNRSVSEVEDDFRWTPERIEEVNKSLRNTLGLPDEGFSISLALAQDKQRDLDAWWDQQGRFLPPEVLTELGLESTEQGPTVPEFEAAQSRAQLNLIMEALNISGPGIDISGDPLAEFVTEPPVDPSDLPADLTGIEAEPQPKTLDIIKSASDEDIEFLREFLIGKPLALPPEVARAIFVEAEIREAMPFVLDEMAKNPAFILFGTDFFNTFTLGLPEFLSRKGITDPQGAILINAVARVRERMNQQDPSLLTRIGLSSGEVLADIIKFALLPDVGKISIFAKLPKAVKAALGVGTKAGLIELLRAPEAGETFDERLKSTAIATGSGAVAGAVFSLALSGLSAIGAKITTKIAANKTEAIRKALIQRDPKLEAYINTLNDRQINNLRNAINDSVAVQVGDMTQATWDANHKPFIIALAKDAIEFAEQQAPLRGVGLMRAGFAEIGPTEPGKRLIKQIGEQISKQTAARLGPAVVAKLQTELATLRGKPISVQTSTELARMTEIERELGIKPSAEVLAEQAVEEPAPVTAVEPTVTPTAEEIEAPKAPKKPKVIKAPAATTGEPRLLPESRNEQLTSEIAEMEKMQQRALSQLPTQRDEAFAEHLEGEIKKAKDEIKQNKAEKAKITKLLRDETFDPVQKGRTLKEISNDAATNLVQIAKSVRDMLVQIFEPAKPVEKRLGPNAYSTVIRGIMLPEVRALEFNEQVLDAVDTNFGELEKFFGKFSKQDLKNFMLSRGDPRGDMAKEIQKAASLKVPDELKNPAFQRALKEIADFNFVKLAEVAEGDVNKVRDYFYGIYKNDRGEVDKFLDKFYRTTERFTKEKALPTVADAQEFGLELRSNNPVTNLRSEWAGISRLEGMQLMRDELMRFGKGEFIDEAFKDIPADWVKIGDEPVFAGLRADPDLARLINNLIAVNKIDQWMPLRVMRGVNNVLRVFKFAGSGFHLTVEASQSLADVPLLDPASGLAGFNTGFRKNDPVFKTPEYRDYIGLGGGQRTSVEAEAQALFDEIVSALGKPGIAAKAAISPLIIMNKFTEWMFNSYIPKLKYAKYIDFVTDRERKLGRGLTDAEKINIIKEGQNFYGEMNEKLFGRSGTVTSLMRFIFLAPGFAEGNYRTIAKGATQWGIGDGFVASRSRKNIVNSLLLKAAAATVGTMILTGKAPKQPETAEEFRDVFKIDTGKTDDKGRKILIDTLTYDKDYYNILLGWAQKGTTSLGKEVLRRVGGMRAPLADMSYDLITVAFNKDIYDWKGDKVIRETDPILVKLRELALFELKKTEPISVSVFRQGLNRGMNFPVAALQAITGVRPTLTEKELRKAKVLQKTYELWGEREEVFIAVRTANKPRARIAAYNKNVKRIMDSKKVDPEIREEFRDQLLIDTDEFLKNKEKSYQSSSQTKKEAARTRELLVNFKIEPTGIWEVSDELSDRLSAFTTTRRRLQGKVDDGSATIVERTRSLVFNGLSTRISKVAKVIAETEEPERSEQLVDIVENMLSLAENQEK